MHGMHSGSVHTWMLAVFKVVKVFKHIWNAPTCVVNQSLKQKVQVSTQGRSFGMISMHYHIFIQLYVAEVMH